MQAIAMAESGLRHGLAAFAMLWWCEAARREGERERESGGHRRVPLYPTKLVRWLTSMETVVRAENDDGGELGENST